MKKFEGNSMQCMYLKILFKMALGLEIREAGYLFKKIFLSLKQVESKTK